MPLPEQTKQIGPAPARAASRPPWQWGFVVLAASYAGYGLSVWLRPSFGMIDTRVYLAGARVLLRGHDLYAMRTTGAHLPFTYPPIAAMLFTWMPAVGLFWAKVGSIVL